MKRIIIIELTCPCEENMESWHSIKLSKYLSLVDVIRRSGWFVDLFAIEVGARGYCSRSVPLCLKKLGFTNKEAFLVSRQLGDTSMKASFCIWLSRDSPVWNQPISYYLVNYLYLLPVASSTPKRKSSAPVKEPPSKKTNDI